MIQPIARRILTKVSSREHDRSLCPGLIIPVPLDASPWSGIRLVKTTLSSAFTTASRSFVDRCDEVPPIRRIDPFLDTLVHDGSDSSLSSSWASCFRRSCFFPGAVHLQGIKCRQVLLWNGRRDLQTTLRFDHCLQHLRLTFLFDQLHGQQLELHFAPPVGLVSS